jgi:hypothetical protein
MKRLSLIFGFVLYWSCTSPLLAQPYLVKDSEAIEQSTQHLVFNFLKQQRHREILEEKQGINRHYTALINLQQQVIQQLRQVRSVGDLQWADLSKASYLAEELVRGARSPGLEFDFRVEHPALEQSPAQTYRALFIAGAGDPLPATLQAIQEANHRSKALINSFTQVAGKRKAYAAVAFQYLSEDLKLKAAEMNALLKQSQRQSRPGVATPGFSMTEAERLKLQSEAEELLERAAQMLERSDQMLLEVAGTPVIQKQALEQQVRQERVELGGTQLFAY